MRKVKEATAKKAEPKKEKTPLEKLETSMQTKFRNLQRKQAKLEQEVEGLKDQLLQQAKQEASKAEPVEPPPYEPEPADSLVVQKPEAARGVLDTFRRDVVQYQKAFMAHGMVNDAETCQIIVETLEARIESI